MVYHLPCGILGEACQPRPHTKTEHAASHSSRLVPQPLSTHQAASAAVTETISGCMQAAKPLPPGLLLFKVPFITAFHLFFVCVCVSFPSIHSSIPLCHEQDAHSRC